MLVKGLPAAFALADYYILMAIIMFFAKGMTSSFKDAFDLFSTLNDIFVLSFSYGMIETVGIFGSQAKGSGDKSRAYLLMCQGNALVVVYLFIMIFPLINYSEDIFSFLGFETEVGDTISRL